MRAALRTLAAGALLVVGCAVLAGCIVLDYFTDPRPYPMGPRRCPRTPDRS